MESDQEDHDAHPAGLLSPATEQASRETVSGRRDKLKMSIARWAALAILAATTFAPGAHAANCLEYLTAEAAFEEAIAPNWKAEAAYRLQLATAEKDFKKARKTAKEAYKRIRGTIARDHRTRISAAWKLVLVARKKSRADAIAARKKYKKMRAVISAETDRRGSELESAWNDEIRSAKEARSKAKKSAESAYRTAMEKNRKGTRAAVKALSDGFMEAYDNPGTGSRRRVSRYDRAIVLRLAKHERFRHCAKPRNKLLNDFPALQ